MRIGGSLGGGIAGWGRGRRRIMGMGIRVVREEGKEVVVDRGFKGNKEGMDGVLGEEGGCLDECLPRVCKSQSCRRLSFTRISRSARTRRGMEGKIGGIRGAREGKDMFRYPIHEIHSELSGKGYVAGYRL